MLRIKMLVQKVLHRCNDEEGATAIEYGLLAALISVTIIASATLVGTNLNLVFNAVAASLAGAV